MLLVAYLAVVFLFVIFGALTIDTHTKAWQEVGIWVIEIGT
jgi:hypothetical protein